MSLENAKRLCEGGCGREVGSPYRLCISCGSGTTIDHPLAGKTFNVSFKFDADGRVKYVFAKPDMCFQAGGARNIVQLQERIAEMVEEETRYSERSK